MVPAGGVAYGTHGRPGPATPVTRSEDEDDDPRSTAIPWLPVPPAPPVAVPRTDQPLGTVSGDEATMPEPVALQTPTSEERPGPLPSTMPVTPPPSAWRRRTVVADTPDAPRVGPSRAQPPVGAVSPGVEAADGSSGTKIPTSVPVHRVPTYGTPDAVTAIELIRVTRQPPDAPVSSAAVVTRCQEVAPGAWASTGVPVPDCTAAI